MRVLHLIPLQNPTKGIVRQAIAESWAAKEAGLAWDVKIFTHNEVDIDAEHIRVGERRPGTGTSQRSWIRHVVEKLKHRKALYRWLEQNHSRYDVILLRHTYADLAKRWAIRRVFTPIFSVHHTLEVPELRLDRSLSGLIRWALERAVGPQNIRRAAGIVGVTGEIAGHELRRSRADKPVLVMPNGLDVEQVQLARDQRSQIPELVFVASEFHPWQGLDRLLDDLGSTDMEFILHLVGKMNARDFKAASHDSRVQIHGELSTREISGLLAHCWVGLSSFALDRKGMHEACPLKVREYLASGIPTYAGHNDCFPDGAVFFASGPANFSSILEFAWATRDVTREQIRDECSEYVSKTAILKATYQRLEGQVEAKK